MRILVTGIGYIGSKLVDKLLRANHEVLVLDNFMYNQFNVLNHWSGDKNLRICNANVSLNIEHYIKLFKPDVIIPTAAIVGEPACRNKEKSAKQVNYQHIVNIVNCVDNTLIIYFNTNSAYGQQKDICDEDTPLNPLSVYSETKCEAEDYLRKNHHNYFIFRLATVFGVSPRMRTDLLVNDLTWQAFLNRKLEIFEPDFKRNFIHIDDVCDCVQATLSLYKKHDKKPIKYTNGFGVSSDNIFNLGLDKANMTKGELAQLICNITNSDYSIKEGKDPDGRDYNVSNEKVRIIYKPYRSLKSGILELLSYYSNMYNGIMSNNQFDQKDIFLKEIMKMRNV